MRLEALAAETSTQPTALPAPRPFCPDAVAYREAIQTPSVSLAFGPLRTARVALDKRELPVAYSGRFAVVFRLLLSGGETWALRCFTSPGGNGGEQAWRYRALAPVAEKLPRWFVPFAYLEQGIKVGTAWFPVVAMQWGTGEPLGRWVETHVRDAPALRTLCETLSALLQDLETAHITHGDFQHDNLLVADGGKTVTLVDYDGVFVPELALLPPDETGHPNYQHPRRTIADYGPHGDRFSCLVLQTALLGLSHAPDLWTQFSDGESILFRKSDFLDPAHSPVFRVLRDIAQVAGDEWLADSLARLEDACRVGASETLAPVVPAAVPVAPQNEPVSPSTPAFAALFADALAAPFGVVSMSGETSSGATKWWQGTSTSKAVPVKPTATSATAPSAAQAQTYKFLSRLSTPEVLKEEQKFIWLSRVLALTLLLALCSVCYELFSLKHNFSSVTIMCTQLISSVFLGHTRWPRLKVYGVLSAEVEKMENLAKGRKEAILMASVTNTITTNSNTGNTPQTAAGFVAEKLRQTDINRILLESAKFQPSTVRLLKQQGIENALDLQRRTHIAHVPPHQITALQQWCRNQEVQFAVEYRKAVVSGTVLRQSSASLNTSATAAEIARLNDEMREFEAEAARLRQERDLFPDVSYKAYWRRLLGLPDALKPQAAPKP